MKDIFTETDFTVAKNIYNCVTWVPPFWAAQVANNKFNEWLEKSSQTVYICDKELKTVHFVEPVDATHKGLLICVEELPKKECEHDNAHSLNNNPFYWSCQDCGKMLRIKFEVVE